MTLLKDAKPNPDIARKLELGDLQSMVRVYAREAVESYSVPITDQNIVIPSSMYELTKSFVRVPQENRGVMLASVSESAGKQFYLVEYMQTLGYGDSVSVYPSEEKRLAFIEMMKAHGQGMKTIEYHTHTTTTGASWFEKFSGGDFQTIHGVLKTNPDYIHTLFTPTHLLTLAGEETSVQLAKVSTESNNIVRNKAMKWQEIFKSFLPSAPLT